MANMNYLILLLPISLIIINLPVLKNKIRISGFKNKPEDCRLKTIRGDTCLNQKYNGCPMSTYKQCTNNNLPVNRCLCNERSFEMCPLHDQYGEICAVNNFPTIKKRDEIQYPQHYPRVNMYKSNATKFDYI